MGDRVADTANDKRTIFGWAMYDWANSAYITIAGAVIAPFFTGGIVPDDGYSVFGIQMSGETLWATVVSIGALVLFLVMPVLGAIADFSGAKRKFLRAFAVTGGVVMILMTLIPNGSVAFFLGAFLITNLAFVAANVMYDGLLVDITDDDTIDTVSSKGYAYGYVGGGLYLLLALQLITLSEGVGSVTGLETDTAVRIAIAGAGVWWIAFTWFSLGRMQIHEAATAVGDGSWKDYARVGFSRTLSIGKQLTKMRHLTLFVVAFMLFNDGTQTVINISGAYARETLNLELKTIATAFLIVQFIAFVGALAFGVLANRIGPKNAILVSLVGWSLTTIGGFSLPEGDATAFLALAATIGLVLGGTQALARSLYGTMIPEEASAEFFGFFSVFSKFSAIFGPLIFAVVSFQTGSGRPAILSILFFFVTGGILLSRVDVDAARESRSAFELEHIAKM
jgi:MFS transporter, UMF1 family